MSGVQQKSVMMYIHAHTDWGHDFQKKSSVCSKILSTCLKFILQHQLKNLFTNRFYGPKSFLSGSQNNRKIFRKLGHILSITLD